MTSLSNSTLYHCAVVIVATLSGVLSQTHLIELILIKPAFPFTGNAGDVSDTQVHSMASKPGFGESITVQGPWSRGQVHELSRSPSIDGIGDTSLNYVPICFSRL